MLSPWALVRRLIVLVVGTGVVLVGVLMLFGPGPAIVVIPVGLAILATEFKWAHQLLTRFREETSKRAHQAGGWWQRWRNSRKN